MRNNLEKETITIYLSQTLAEQIDDTLFSVRKSLPRHQRKQLTKSAFYQLIMTALVENFNKMGKGSLLVKLIDDWAEELSK